MNPNSIKTATTIAGHHRDEAGLWPPSSPWPLLLAIDRTVINLTVEPLKAQFDLNDTLRHASERCLGIFYTLGLFSVGRLVDRFRAKVLGICLFFFSLFSMASV